MGIKIEIITPSYISRAMSDPGESVGPIGHFELNGAKYVVFPGLGGGGT